MSPDYIKFSCDWRRTDALQPSLLHELKQYRDRLHQMGLIGSRDGEGYGNISIRHKQGFIITGTATGELVQISDEAFTFVSHFDIDSNSVRCEGPAKASSESLTHAALYSRPEINAVIHVHSAALWELYYGKLPTTSESAEYGTPELAREMLKMDSDVIIMGGHPEGIMACGKDIESAFKSLAKLI